MRSDLFFRKVRHFIFLVPIGSIVGLLAGIAFKDVLFGLGVGFAFGTALALLFTLQTHG